MGPTVRPAWTTPLPIGREVSASKREASFSNNSFGGHVSASWCVPFKSAFVRWQNHFIECVVEYVWGQCAAMDHGVVGLLEKFVQYVI